MKTKIEIKKSDFVNLSFTLPENEQAKAQENKSSEESFRLKYEFNQLNEVFTDKLEKYNVKNSELSIELKHEQKPNEQLDANLTEEKTKITTKKKIIHFSQSLVFKNEAKATKEQKPHSKKHMQTEAKIEQKINEELPLAEEKSKASNQSKRKPRPQSLTLFSATAKETPMRPSKSNDEIHEKSKQTNESNFF